MDMRTLVLRAQQGDHEAFAGLVVHVTPRLDKLARLITRDPELAKDAVQESLLRAWRGLKGLRDPDRFEAWLNRMTVRECVSLASSRRRMAIEVELPDTMSQRDGDIVDTVAQREFVDLALARLEPDRRALVVLHAYLGLSVPEAAEVLGVPLGTAKSRLSRALASLRVSMAFETSDREPLPATTGGRR
jgi:RNA polymerase sigma-70 factor (ECF subfamily)